MKKALSIALAMALIAGTFAGCGGSSTPAETSTAASSPSQASSSSVSSKPVEISIGYWDVETALKGGDSDKMAKKVLNDLNVKIVPMNTTWDDYHQKIQLWAASSQLPDLFAVDTVGSSFYYTWIDQGVVQPLPEDLSKYPKLQEYMKTPDIEALKIDNKFYCIPRMVYQDIKMSGTGRGIIYRWDLAQKAGITKEPETYDEFRTMIKAIIKDNSEGKHIAGMTSVQNQLLDGVLCQYSMPNTMSDGSGSDFKWMEKDGKYVPAYFAGDALSTFQLARDMYKEGTIEKEIALTKSTQAYDKFIQGQSSAIVMVPSANNVQNNLGIPWAKANPDKDFTTCCKYLNPLKAKDGNTYGSVFKSYWSESYIATKDPEKMNKIMEMADYFLTKENDDLLRHGFKDEDYKVSADGTYVPTAGLVLSEKYPFSWIASLFKFGDGSEGIALTGDKETDKYRKMAQDYWAKIQKTTYPEYNAAYTNISTPTKNTFVIKPSDDLLTIMTGNEPVEDMYKKLLATYESKGLSKMEDEVNAKIKASK